MIHDISPDYPVDDDWNLMGIAPKDATEVRLLFPDGSSIIAHWAHGGGEDQPPFGPGWFTRRSDDPRHGFIEVAKDPICWKPLPAAQTTADQCKPGQGET